MRKKIAILISLSLCIAVAYANPVSVDVTIGSSDSNTKSVTVIFSDLICPSEVKKGNWLGTETYYDRFEIKVFRYQITAHRVDSGGGWGMNLSFRCQRCLAPKYINENKCVDCPSGGYTCDGTKSIKCNAPKIVDKHHNKCEACPSGYTCNGVEKKKCDALNYVNEHKCVACPRGYTCDGAGAKKCNAPNYVDNNICDDCPIGYTCNGVEKKKCDALNYVNENKCEACPSGYTCNGVEKKKCDALNYVNENKCVACPSGYTCDGAVSTKCDAPKYIKDNECVAVLSGLKLKDKNAAIMFGNNGDVVIKHSNGTLVIDAQVVEVTGKMKVDNLIISGLKNVNVELTQQIEKQGNLILSLFDKIKTINTTLFGLLQSSTSNTKKNEI